VLSCGHARALYHGSSWYRMRSGDRADGTPIPITVHPDDGRDPFPCLWGRACPDCVTQAKGDPAKIVWCADHKHDGTPIEMLMPD
jgi:hypothetical protein